MPLICALLSLACGPGDHDTEEAATSTAAEAPPSGVAPPLPAPGSAPPPASAGPRPRDPEPSCAQDMVLVRNKLCVDRYESHVVDDLTQQPLSPYYPPEAGKSAFIEKVWRDQKGTGTALEQRTELPVLPAWQKQKGMKPRAVAQKGRTPQAYASGKNADEACRNAGKRLCLREEWRMACRGQEDRDFPYGDTYQQGRCNTVRETHPGVLLWDNASINHTDPRFNLSGIL